MNFVEYAISKLRNPSGLVKLVREPQRIKNYIASMLSDFRDETLRGERSIFYGTFCALTELLQRYRGSGNATVESLDEFHEIAEDKDCKDLAELFALYGSDKSTTHNYHLIYGQILYGRRHQPLNILEIGLGTCNTDVPSNMGSQGKPGASVRAFRDWATNATVVGADIDRRVLFSEERIVTYFVDQTDPETLRELAQRFQKNSFDLFIDDGLHNTWANFNTLSIGLDLIKSNGAIVIEDISESYLPAWQAASIILDKDYYCRLIRTRNAYVCLIRKKIALSGAHYSSRLRFKPSK